MTKKNKMLLSICFFGLLFVVAFFSYKAMLNDSQENASINQEERVKAEDFKMVDQKGNTVALSDMKGKPVVLNFWASWCPPCKEEMPTFDKVHKEFQEDVAFMMVDLVDGQRETREKGHAYVTENGFSFPVYYDTEQKGAIAYDIYSIPTTLFIDADGYLIQRTEGTMTEDSLRQGIAALQSD